MVDGESKKGDVSESTDEKPNICQAIPDAQIIAPIMVDFQYIDGLSQVKML